MHKLFIILALLLLSPAVIGTQLFAQAQQQSATADILDQALHLYDVGQFEECRELLQAHEHEFSGSQRVSVYRMLCLISMYYDEIAQSERYADMLLRQDPFYTAYNENPRFRDLIEKLKKGESTISTASQQSESLDEAPVPVTLITRQMIEMSGARNLQELLALFVPGVSIIEGQETNLAMRGVYSQNQESILFMLDGHRLNSQSSNTEAPDFRTSLDKIQQIEVLRGPASSLYGNVALTAVVNIITRRGSEIDGHSLTFAGGKNQTIGGTYLYGKGNLTQDVMAWASFYNSKGEPVTYDAIVSSIDYVKEDGSWVYKHDNCGQNTRYVGGFNHKPAFDIGLRCRWDDLTFLFSAQQSKRTPYYSQIASGDIFEYDDYATYRGSSPGTSRTQYMASVDYEHKYDNFSLKMSGYGMIEDSQLYNVLGDSINSLLGTFLNMLILGEREPILAALDGDYGPFVNYILENKPNVQTRGVWQSVNWSSKTFGGSAQIGFNYKAGKQRGNLLAGIQYDYFNLPEGSFVLGHHYSEISGISLAAIQQGDEQTLSAFLQMKHYFTDKLIFNGGFRFDHKARINSERLSSFSPRVTLIWQPVSYFTAKLGYAHSFVDAPYIYRASRIALYRGEDLRAEKMDAFQLTATANLPQLNLRVESNLFYNHVDNVVFMDVSNLDNEQGVIVNSGKINTVGFENVIEYHAPRTLVNANFTYQKATSVGGFPYVHGRVCNVPNTLANLTASRILFDHDRFGSMWVRGNMHYQGNIYMLKMNVLESFAKYFKQHQQKDEIQLSDDDMYPNELQNPVFTANLGLDWKWHNLKFSFDCYNLFNAQYKAGGMLLDAVPQMSRSYMAKINIKL